MKSAQTIKPRLLNINEVCALLGTSRTTLYEMMNKGELAYVMLGDRRRIPVTEIDRIESEARRAALL